MVPVFNSWIYITSLQYDAKHIYVISVRGQNVTEGELNKSDLILQV